MKTTSPTSSIAPIAAEPATISKMEENESNIYEHSNQNAADMKCT